MARSVGGFASRLPRLTWVSAFASGLLFLGASLQPAHAQSFLIRGIVTQGTATGPPAASATVFIPGTLFGGLTDPEGRFELGPVPPGEYSLHVRVPDFRELVTAIAITDADLDLRLVARAADVDLEPEVFTSENDRPEFRVRSFREPGTIADLLRADPAFQVGRVGFSGGRVLYGSSQETAPMRSTSLSLDGWASWDATAFPMTRELSLDGPMPRRYEVVPLGRGNGFVLRSTDESQGPTAERPLRLVLGGGAHSNGRLAEASGRASGSIGRVSYEASLSGVRAPGASDADSVGTPRASIHRLESYATASIRLTPFSDVLVRAAGFENRDAVVPESPVDLDRAASVRGDLSYRLALPDATIKQFTMRVLAARGQERPELVPENGSRSIDSERWTVVAAVTHSWTPLVTGTLGMNAERFKQNLSYSELTVAPWLDPWTRSEVGGTYSVRANVATLDLSGTLAYSSVLLATDDSDTPLSRTFNTVGTSLEVRRALSAGIGAAVELQSSTEAPTAAQLFGVRFPSIVGQRFIPVVGNPELKAGTSRSATIRTSYSSGSRFLSLGVRVTDLHRYTTVGTIDGVDQFVQSNGTAFDLDVRADIAREPIAGASLIAFLPLSRDHSEDRPLLGRRMPQLQLSGRLQTPGGRFFLRPAINGVYGLDSADPRWESATSSAIWVDITVGVERLRTQWTAGVTNINDATWRYHASPVTSSSQRVLSERGRSLFFMLLYRI